MSYEQAVVNLQETNAELVKAVNRVRDAAMGMNRMYSSTSAGVAAVQDGEYFVVPGGGVYQRLYQRSGGSATLIAEYPDRASLDSVIDQLGPLLGRGVVGSGDLMARGAFGLGGNSGDPVGVLSEITQTGFYKIDSNDPDLPRTTGVGRVLHITGGSNGFATQLLTIGSGGVNGNLYIRSQNSGAWGPFRFIYDSEGILGTVSQSDGVPTGAIIERGSNANGEYAKFADGTLFMQRQIGNQLVATPDAFRGMYRSAPMSAALPHPFVPGSETAAIGFRSPLANALFGEAGVSAGSWQYRFASFISRDGTSGSDATDVVYLSAWARWY